MKFYRLVLILSLSAFFSCAVQAPPGGGPVYDKALTISDITPPPIVSTGMNKKETVKIFFNQMVDPYTAKMSFSVYPETKINVNVIGRKIEISVDATTPDEVVQKFWIGECQAYTSKPIPEMIIVGHSLRPYFANV